MAAGCALALVGLLAAPGRADAASLGGFMPGSEPVLLAMLGLGLTVAGVLIGRRNGDD